MKAALPMTLQLRHVRIQDEQVVRAAHEAMAHEGFDFALGLESTKPFAHYVQSLADRSNGRNLPHGWVAESFWLAEVTGIVVGRLSLRHRLNERLHASGGHIGYGVLPGHRLRGHATEMLRQALVEARALGLARVLLTCDAGNIGSRRTIATGAHEVEPLHHEATRMTFDPSVTGGRAPRRA